MPNAPRSSRRPMRRPEADESTTDAAQVTRPRPRPESVEDRAYFGPRIEMGNRQDPGVRPGSEDTQRYAEGGMVRGCKPGQMTGKGFSGSY